MTPISILRICQCCKASMTICVSTSDESRAIGAQDEEQFTVLEDIPVQNEVVENICIEQVPASKSADLHTALPSTSKTAVVLTNSRSPKSIVYLKRKDRSKKDD
ncbi:uncharacterized protein [Anabrus simplex]|uniref:uncharacterized protein n=1 Tax=Anabrus simplex TaxID=316456 RepID=UPI0035A31392